MSPRARSWSFRAVDGGWVVAVDPSERAVLLDVVDQVVELLGGEDVVEPRADAEPLDTVRLDLDPVPVPDDPAVRRLLPDASPDPQVAAEFRRLVDQDLRATKVGHLMRLRAALADARQEVVVVPSEARMIAAALTDLRLVLAERLGLRSDEDADEVHRLALQHGDSPREWLAAVYTVLTVLQESLVELMLADLPQGPTRLAP